MNVSICPIRVMHGDTEKRKVIIKKPDGSIREMDPTDKVFFTVKEKGIDGPALIRKQIDIQEMILKINPEDTIPLKMPYVYEYDIEVHAGGEIKTILKGDFMVYREVGTWADVKE